MLFTGDGVTAKEKLAKYYLREFTEMSLYSSSEEKNKVPLPKLYVPMIWRPYSQRGYGEEEELSSYTDIYQKVCSFLSPLEIKLKSILTL